MTPSSPAPDGAPLRRCVLAVAVLEDLDLQPVDAGVLLLGGRPVALPWSAVAAVAGPAAGGGAVEPDEPGTRARLAAWLRLHRLVGDLGSGAGEVLRAAARPLALGARSPLRPPGPWAMQPVRGGALDLGVGVVGLAGPADVVPLHPDVAEEAGVDVRAWWPTLLHRLEEVGGLAAARLRRDGDAGRARVLRPVGDCDVPTLLAARSLREHLAAEDGTGMRAVAVPCRTRGWFDLARIDPAFVGAAWTATDVAERAFARPLLVTADEVAVAARREGLVTAALADPVRGRAADVLDVRDLRPAVPGPLSGRLPGPR